MSDLLTISIRRKLDKGDKIGTNEIRSLLAVVDMLKKRNAELETDAKDARFMRDVWKTIREHSYALFLRLHELDAGQLWDLTQLREEFQKQIRDEQKSSDGLWETMGRQANAELLVEDAEQPAPTKES